MEIRAGGPHNAVFVVWGSGRSPRLHRTEPGCPMAGWPSPSHEIPIWGCRPLRLRSRQALPARLYLEKPPEGGPPRRTTITSQRSMWGQPPSAVHRAKLGAFLAKGKIGDAGPPLHHHELGCPTLRDVRSVGTTAQSREGHEFTRAVKLIETSRASAPEVYAW